jgi:phosphohistidine phosphatase
MDLYVLRHAIAVERGTRDYLEDDSKRPLTKKGIRRMRRGVRGLARAGLAFDLLLTSPYARARQTAEIVAEALEGDDRMEVFQPLTPETPPEQAIRQIARRTEKLDSVLLVGHEPQLSAIGSLLLAGNSGLALELGKGGAFKLEAEQLVPGAAVLEWWLTPRQLRRLGETV